MNDFRTELSNFVKNAMCITLPNGKSQSKTHEALVEYELIDSGFTKVEYNLSVTDRKNFKKGIPFPQLKDGEFIVQPLGTQACPDMVFAAGGKQYALEAKSSISNTPFYNKMLWPDAIYLFSNPTFGTTLYFSEQIVTQDERDFIKETEMMVRKLLEDREQIAQEKGFSKHIKLYCRFQLSNVGSSPYFTAEFKDDFMKRLNEEMGMTCDA